MAEKFNSDSNLSTEELAKYLQHPSGETGKEVGIQRKNILTKIENTTLQMKLSVKALFLVFS